MERKETSLHNREPIVIMDNIMPDELIFANVQGIKDHSQEGDDGKKIFVQTLDGRSFDFTTLLKIGHGRYTSRDSRYTFIRAGLLDPNDPIDLEIIKRAINNSAHVINGHGASSLHR